MQRTLAPTRDPDHVSVLVHPGVKFGIPKSIMPIQRTLTPAHDPEHPFILIMTVIVMKMMKSKGGMDRADLSLIVEKLCFFWRKKIRFDSGNAVSEWLWNCPDQ